MKKNRIKIFTDGSIVNIKNNDTVANVSSYGFIAVRRDEDGEDVKLGSKVVVVENSTISEMEIRAILIGIHFSLQSVKKDEQAGLTVEVYSDSKMAVSAFNEYIPNWTRRALTSGGDWKSSNGQPVAHQSLYKEVLALTAAIKVKYIHVNSHKDHVLNNEIDKMVREATQARVSELAEA